ncbi:hypothetical protein CVT24_001472 [Panaeolus cyanescens]|uniref:Uncharacterized protein n=1 Tax=Panaeolus cyanescens TaxID=181874 RepID=A0A409YYV2_9AGAR|nr:hypothetical protein CVT24_001472 [Panaeolus cyanescens]
MFLLQCQSDVGTVKVVNFSRPRFVSHVLQNLDECSPASDTLIRWFEQFRAFLQDETSSLVLPGHNKLLWYDATRSIESYANIFQRIRKEYPSLFKQYPEDIVNESEIDSKDRLLHIEVPTPRVPIPPPYKPPIPRQEDMSKIPYEYCNKKPDDKQSYKATLASIDIVSSNVSRLTFSFEVLTGSNFTTSGFSIGFCFKTRDRHNPTPSIQVVATAPNTIHELKDFTNDECNTAIQVKFPEPQMVEWHFRRHFWQVLTKTKFPQTFNLSVSVQHEGDITASVDITVFRRPTLLASNISHKSTYSPTIMEILKGSEASSDTQPNDVDSRVVARLIPS